MTTETIIAEDDGDIGCPDLQKSFRCACCYHPWPDSILSHCHKCGFAGRIQDAPLTEDDWRYAAAQRAISPPDAEQMVPLAELQSLFAAFDGCRRRCAVDRFDSPLADSQQYFCGCEDAYDRAANMVADVLRRYAK